MPFKEKHTSFFFLLHKWFLFWNGSPGSGESWKGHSGIISITLSITLPSVIPRWWNAVLTLVKNIQTYSKCCFYDALKFCNRSCYRYFTYYLSWRISFKIRIITQYCLFPPIQCSCCTFLNIPKRGSPLFRVWDQLFDHILRILTI